MFISTSIKDRPSFSCRIDIWWPSSRGSLLSTMIQAMYVADILGPYLFHQTMGLASLLSLYSLFNKVEGGILVSPCPSVRPSVRLSVCGHNRVRSVSSTILAGSSSDLHILSSNFNGCVAREVYLKIQKIWTFGKLFKLVTLTLYWFYLVPIWLNGMGNHGATGGIVRTHAFYLF